jgi:cytochrome c oxidase subunit III
MRPHRRGGATARPCASASAAPSSTLAFLAGQLAAWAELSASGFLLAGNPADSFFYLLTGMHGLHIAGGLVALGAVAPGLWRRSVHVNTYSSRNQRLDGHCNVQSPDILRLDLCAMYWHFLLFVWFGLLALFTGWAAEAIEICRAILS